MRKILILSSMEPDKNNRGGPTGLLWECQEVLSTLEATIDIRIRQCHSVIDKMGIFFPDYGFDYNRYDLIFIYPFNLAFYLPRRYRKKAIILGPDSPSLLFARMEKVASSFLKKVKYALLTQWFILRERKVLREFSHFMVVGNNDRRWLNIKIGDLKAINFSYLPHPVLRMVKEEFQTRPVFQNEGKFLIFAGDMSPKYTGDYISQFKEYLPVLFEKTDLDILIVGKNNRWIYDMFSGHKDSGKVRVLYEQWVEQYSSLCIPENHIHIIPLAAGAGTKNRTITASVFGVTVVSTDIGLENTLEALPPGKVYRANKVEKMVEYIILEAGQETFAPEGIDLELYIRRVDERFKREFMKVIQ